MTNRDRSVPTMRPDTECPFARGLTAITSADRTAELLAGTVRLAPHATAELSHPPDWASDPFGDANWRFQFHSLQWCQSLKRSHDTTGDLVPLQRYFELLEHWYVANPWDDPPSDQSWADHSIALRARVYAACAQAIVGPLPQWLRLALDEHVDVLSGPDLYPSGGNHALNQNVGLFAAASMLGRDIEQQHAIARTEELLARSVADDGVTDEQSTEYQTYNFRRYREAAELFRATGVTLSAVFDRIARMPEMIGHATLPDGRDAMIGDSRDGRAFSVPGTIAEFAATTGQSGSRPHDRVRIFDHGYVFARTGWGEHRPLTDETHLSIRFGPGRIPHGHHDAGAITLYAYGSRILSNAGKYGYTWDPYRAYVLSRRAQNTITFNRVPFGPDGGSELAASTFDDELVVVKIRDLHYPDVDYTRTVVFDLDAGMVVVADRFASLDGRDVSAEQRFRLNPGLAHIESSGNELQARRNDGLALTLTQFADADEIRTVRGSEDPIDGWVSYTYGKMEQTHVVITKVTANQGLLVTGLTCHPPAPADTESDSEQTLPSNTTLSSQADDRGHTIRNTRSPMHFDATTSELHIGDRRISLADDS